MLKRTVYASVHNTSHARGSEALRHLADLDVPTKQVERIAQRIGAERCAERDRDVQAYLALPLVERKTVPPGVVAPKLAVVQIDGGRLQILDRSTTSASDATAPPDAHTSHWREDKVGLLATMSSAAGSSDPCPTIPGHFLDLKRISKLTREIKGSVSVATEDVPAAATEDVPAAAAADATVAANESSYTAPALEKRSVVATRADAYEFGGIVAQEAWKRGFFGAERRAFVADGSSTNWGVWERHFSSFAPIVDFIHALTYVFNAATTGRTAEQGGLVYAEWIGHVWAGQIEKVIDALVVRQAELGLPMPDDAETSPRQRVAETMSYLQNQKERMRYAEYRKQGLPITSCHIESTIKQINQRVKGTEKFWSEQGAEWMLQLRADALSETEPLVEFWQRRQIAASGQRCYSNAV